MDRRIKRFGIGALVALLMVSMLVGSAAAADVSIWADSPTALGGPGCRNETGALLFGNGIAGESCTGMVIDDVDKDGIDGFDPDNPPYYLVGDDQRLRWEHPMDWVTIAWQSGMGEGGFYGMIFDAPEVGDHIYVRLFNDVSVEESTYYGDSELYVIVGDATYEYPNWNTTIPIDWGGETFNKDLEPGWNLVSLPLTPEDNSTPVVLASIATKYDSVMKYTPGTGFEAVTTTVMDPGVGYFIYMNTNGTWTYDGESYDAITAPLSQGLNMVGWVNDDVALPGALGSITGNYNYVARWDATAGNYEVYEPDAPAIFNDFGTIAKGEGYFIAAKTGCTLTYS